MASEGKAEFTQLETLSRNVQVNIVHYRVGLLSPFTTPGRLQLITLILSKNVDQKSQETVFLIAICSQSATNGNQKHCFQ